MAIYYENLVRILCGLVKMALIHALEKAKHLNEEMYIPGSRIVRAEYFGKIVAIKEEMAAKGVSEYILVKINADKQNLVQIGNKLSNMIRSTDLIGLDNDGQMYVCFSQAGKENIEIIINRLKASGLLFNRTKETNY